LRHARRVHFNNIHHIHKKSTVFFYFNRFLAFFLLFFPFSSSFFQEKHEMPIIIQREFLFSEVLKY